jgi:DNA primase
MELSELVARVDLAELVERYTGPGRHRAGGWLYSCPAADHPDRNPSFTVRPDRTGKWWWRCHSQCARGGDALDLLVWLEGQSIAEAAATLRTITGTADEWKPSAPRKPTPAPRPLAPLPTDTSRPPAEVAARLVADYCRHRGWPPEVVERWGLEVVLDTQRRPRIRHPFYAGTPTGPEVRWWQDRAWPTGSPKWQAPPGQPGTLYNLAALENADLRAVVLCEGPADTITATLALEHLGRPEAEVAALGIPGAAAWRPEWGEWLTGLEVVLATDPDPAGDGLAALVAADLAGKAARIRRLTPRGTDLTDFTRTAGLGELARLLEVALGREVAA